MAPYVVHIHLKNSRPAYPGERVLRKRDAIDGRTLTGTVLDGGLVPIPALLDELKSLDYHGCLLIEYQGEIDPRIALPYNVEYLRRQMQGR
jgi:sugar phosphate isomerase/epimerase